jgi:hypothetical protein
METSRRRSTWHNQKDLWFQVKKLHDGKPYMGFNGLLKLGMKKMICILETKVFYNMMQIIIFTTP